ncbi:MAG: hypothetical protein ACXU8O_04750 [Asticcacaulis sp.]
MVSDLPHYDSPAFSLTVFSILDRYRTGMVDQRNASRALSAITLALAPEGLLDGHAEEKLDRFFVERLDHYRDGIEIERVRSDVVRAMMAAAESDWGVLHGYGLWRGTDGL